MKRKNSSSTMPSLRFVALQNEPYANKGYRVHLVCPLQQAPFHRTRLLRKGESAEVRLTQGPFYLVLHAYEGKRLSGREVVEVELKDYVPTARFRDVSVSLGLSEVQPYALDAVFRAGIAEATKRLSLYVQQDLERLQQMQPRERALQHTHSVYYEFPLQPTLFVPYVALAGRLGKRLSCTEKELNDWQSFFIREFPIAMRECAASPAQFVSKCRENSLTNADLFYLYNTIAVAFSRLVASRVSYAKDIEATTMPDYVGFNLINHRLVGDCEDGSQLLYDTMRIFRTIFPLTQQDLSRGQTSLCYYVAHFLNKAELWMLQGAVSEESQTHVWCAIMPHAGPVHFVESTGLPESSFYKSIVRAWQIDDAGHFADNLLVDPERPQLYGMPTSTLTHYKADGLASFRRWSLRRKEAINHELAFANLLDAPLMHPMNLLMRKF